MSKFRFILICAVIFFPLSGCQISGLVSSSVDTVIFNIENGEVNKGETLAIHVVIPESEVHKKNIEKDYTKNVLGWFRLSTEDREQKVEYVANVIVDPQNIKNSVIHAPSSNELFKYENNQLFVEMPDHLYNLAQENGLFVFVLYHYDSDRNKISDEDRNNYNNGGVPFITKNALNNGASLILRLKKAGLTATTI